jgi:hypothetical protein
MPFVNLTDEELVRLDYSNNERLANEIRLAKERVALKGTGLSPIGAEIVQSTLNHGALDVSGVGNMSYPCDRCKAFTTYPLYRSGPRKGQKNLSRPIKIWGVRIGNTYLCSKCYREVLQELAPTLLALPAEVNTPGIGDNGLRKYWMAHCSACDWRGHQGQLGNLPTIIAHGTYKGRCPSCGAANSMFVSPVKFDYSHWVVVDKEGGVVAIR